MAGGVSAAADGGFPVPGRDAQPGRLCSIEFAIAWDRGKAAWKTAAAGIMLSSRLDWMWKVIDRTDLTDAEKQLISLVYPISPAEIK